MPTQSLEISKRTHRRYILGRQGLWPGRRWQGNAGVLDAIQQVESVQVDPVNILCPSHDLVLWGRVLGYQPTDLDSLLYTERKLFDYGGNLNIFPIEELPYWKHVMELRKSEKRWEEFALANGQLIQQVYREVEARGPLRKRDLEGEKISNYRGGKDTGLALYYLWLTGELMSHSRVGRERVYDLAERVAPELAGQRASVEDAIEFLLMKDIAQSGLIAPSYFASLLKALSGGKIDRKQAAGRLQQMLESGQLAAVDAEGIRGAHYCLAGDLALLEDLEAGAVPAGWLPLGPSTTDEVIFLSPLERVSARGRAKRIFDFDYTWEIYKPDDKRQYGPYTLPILYGDLLIGRMDSKLNRETGMLIVNGLWFEPVFEVNKAFANAFKTGLKRLQAFLGASHLDAGAAQHPSLFD